VGTKLLLSKVTWLLEDTLLEITSS